MSILLYPALNKLSTSQWGFFKGYSGTDAELITPIARLNSNHIKIVFTITGTIPLNFQVVLRSYNAQGDSIDRDELLLDRKWSFGDSPRVSLDAYAETNTVAVVFKNLDNPITTYGFNEINISEVINPVSTVELEYAANRQKNILYRNANSVAPSSTVFLSEIVRIRSDKAYVSIREYSPVMTSFRVEYVTNYDGRADHQRPVIIYEGVKRSANATPILIPFVPESKEFRIRITNTTEGETSINLRTVDVIEVDEFLPELEYLTIGETSFTTLEIPSTIEKKTQAILVNKFLHFENPSNYSSIYLQIGSYKKTLQPQEKFEYRNIEKSNSFTHCYDSGAGVLKFTGSKESILPSEKGLKTDLTFRNMRGYNIIRPFPLAKNTVWGTKTNENELWRFNLDDEANILSEELLQTFDLPVIDIFIPTSNAMIISTGNIYATDDSQVNFRLFRSAPSNWGYEVAEITMGAVSTWFPNVGITQSGNTAIMFGEYSTFQPSLSVWRSMDDGLTWSPVLTQTSAEIRHFHTVDSDTNNNNDVYVTSGDAGTQIKWWKSTDRGATFTEMPIEFGILGKILGMDISPEKIIVVTDAPGYLNYIVEVDKNDLSYRILLKTTQVFFGLLRSGTCLFAFTVSQHGGNITSRYDNVNELFYSLDNGKTWNIGWRWPVKNTGGNAGFRYASWADRDGNIFLRTDRNILEGHFLNQNSIRISLKR